MRPMPGSVPGPALHYWARTSRVSIKICKICKICKFANLGEREKASGAGKRSAKTSKLYLSPLDFVVHFCTEIHFARAGDFKAVWLWSQRRPRCARTRPSRRRSRPSREGSVLFHASLLFKLQTKIRLLREGAFSVQLVSPLERCFFGSREAARCILCGASTFCSQLI